LKTKKSKRTLSDILGSKGKIQGVKVGGNGCDKKNIIPTSANGPKDKKSSFLF